MESSGKSLTSDNMWPNYMLTRGENLHLACWFFRVKLGLNHISKIVSLFKISWDICYLVSAMGPSTKHNSIGRASQKMCLKSPTSNNMWSDHTTYKPRQMPQSGD